MFKILSICLLAFVACGSAKPHHIFTTGVNYAAPAVVAPVLTHPVVTHPVVTAVHTPVYTAPVYYHNYAAVHPSYTIYAHGDSGAPLVKQPCKHEDEYTKSQTKKM